MEEKKHMDTVSAAGLLVALGIIYGDIGTSPLYVYATAFGNGVSDVRDVIGSLSLIIWTLTLSPVVKYCWVVLWCDDNGEGGTFAAYGLLARNLGIIRDRAGHVPYEQSVSQFTTEPSSPKYALSPPCPCVSPPHLSGWVAAQARTGG